MDFFIAEGKFEEDRNELAFKLDKYAKHNIL